MRRIERLFEQFLWRSRLVVLVAVVAGLAVAFSMFWVATIDALDVVKHLGHYGDLSLTAEARAGLRSMLVAHVVEVVDGYLLGAIMIIFALGLYELFVSRIEAAEGSEFASRLLLIHSLDDLKDRLAKVVLLILVVKFFEFALRLEFDTPLELLWLALGVALLAAALALSHGRLAASAAPPERRDAEE